MKMNEFLLLELQEVLDRYTTYGSWVDANTKEVFPVKSFGHTTFIRNNVEKLGVDPSVIKQITDVYGNSGLYQVGFMAHLVRIVNESPESVHIDGVASDIAKISKIINATAVQPDVEVVFVDKIKQVGAQSLGSKRFLMPTQRQQLLNYIKGA